MIALDTNILIYARRTEMPHHRMALRILTDLAEGDEPWAIPWPCVYEFIRVMTNPRFLAPPKDLDLILEYLQSLVQSSSLHLLGEGPAHFSHLKRMVIGGRASGSQAYDAHIAALVVEHGVTELWTTDRGFAKFKGLVVRNPFLPEGIREKPRKYRARRPRTSPASA